MTVTSNGLRAAVPLALLAFTLPFAACNPGWLDEVGHPQCCHEFTAGADHSSVDFGLSWEPARTYGALVQAAADLSGAAAATLTEVDGACAHLAADLGGDVGQVKATDPGARARALCDLAATRIRAVTSGKVTVTFQPPVCTVDASLLGGCEARCSDDERCALTPADVVARCDPGKLTGHCAGDCTGSCDGAANVGVDCEGECAGTCEGECAGACSDVDGAGTCKGACSGGACKGTCRGSCKVAAGAHVRCRGACRGGCSVALTAPRCSADLAPPKAACAANPECAAQCRATASAKATCSEPAVTLGAPGGVDPSALASLQVNLPKVLGASRGRVALLIGDAAAVLETATQVAAEDVVVNSTHARACLVPATAAVVQAVDNIEACGEASLAVLAAVGVD